MARRFALSMGGALEQVGMLALARVLTRKKPRVLMYHRFSPTGGRRSMSVEVFECQLKYIKRHFNPMSMDQLVSGIVAGDVPDYAIALTVDDCYFDFHAYAWPLLKKYAVPATIYAVTEFVSQRLWLWPDEIRYILQESKVTQLPFGFGSAKFLVDTRSASLLDKSWEILADYCLSISNELRKDLIDSLAHELYVDVPSAPTEEFRSMTWRQLREVTESGIEVGAHTATHPRLTSLSLLEANAEISGAKEAIEDNLNVTVNSFCYPNGTARDLNWNVKELVRRSGYTNATVSSERCDIKSDLYEIGRIAASSDLSYFKRSISGVSSIAKSVGLR